MQLSSACKQVEFSKRSCPHTTSTRSRKNHPSRPFPSPFLPVSPNIKLRIAFRVYNSDISTTVCSASYAFACFFAKSARHYMKWKIDINCCSWHSSSRAPQCSEHRTTRCCGSIRQTFHRSPLLYKSPWDTLETSTVFEIYSTHYLYLSEFFDIITGLFFITMCETMIFLRIILLTWVYFQYRV